MFDYYMAPGVLKTFRKEFKKFLTYGFEDLAGDECDDIVKVTEEAISYLQTINIDPEEFSETFKDVTSGIDKVAVIKTVDKAYERAYKATEKATYQAMEGLVHNLNTMHSRAGAQVSL